MSTTDLSFRIVNSSAELLELEESWDAFVTRLSDNPFFLTGFVHEFMNIAQSRGWRPTFLVFSSNHRVNGLVPLLVRRRLGMRFAKPLLRNWFSPDFLLDPEHREQSITQTIRFLFDRLRTQIIDLTFPFNSPNLSIVRKSCRNDKHATWEQPANGHCIIPIDKSWEEFEKIRGGNFRRKFRKLERKLSQAGSWRVVKRNLKGRKEEGFERILEIERRSWKKDWRVRMKTELDQDLLTLFQASHKTAESEALTFEVWFLVLNEQELAYSLVVTYKETAFIAKTSYDQRYRSLYPGIYVNNAAIKELFIKRQVKLIDWNTDLPFHRNWTSICPPRIRILISQRSAVPKMLSFLGGSTRTRDFRLTIGRFLDPLLRNSTSLQG
jgi:CelD/BcsL family acetyltransferase involved in cellulose biosynthesis